MGSVDCVFQPVKHKGLEPRGFFSNPQFFHSMLVFPLEHTIPSGLLGILLQGLKRPQDNGQDRRYEQTAPPIQRPIKEVHTLKDDLAILASLSLAILASLSLA